MTRSIYKLCFASAIVIGFVQCNSGDTNKKENVSTAAAEFPDELVNFVAYKSNPVFSGTATDTWDREIRERGYILKEDSMWYMWYTGYQDTNQEKHLGYATSPDGYTWTRYSDKPIYDAGWIEDMSIIKSDSLYYMFSEGRGDTSHLLTSPDRIHWTEKGNLDIRRVNGSPISAGPFGTPAIWKEEDTWYLFYERDDLGIWLATSKDLKVFTNLQDEPVIKLGPAEYDSKGVAMNQIIKYKGLYYGYYHATAFADWHEWSTNVAVSKDLIHWEKYSKNPVVANNESSGIMINDGKRYRLYTMHGKVNVYLPATDSLP